MNPQNHHRLISIITIFIAIPNIVASTHGSQGLKSPLQIAINQINIITHADTQQAENKKA